MKFFTWSVIEKIVKNLLVVAVIPRFLLASFSVSAQNGPGAPNAPGVVQGGILGTPSGDQNRGVAVRSTKTRMHLALDAAGGLDTNPYSVPSDLVSDFVGDLVLRLRPALTVANSTRRCSGMLDSHSIGVSCPACLLNKQETLYFTTRTHTEARV